MVAALVLFPSIFKMHFTSIFVCLVFKKIFYDSNGIFVCLVIKRIYFTFSLSLILTVFHHLNHIYYSDHLYILCHILVISSMLYD